MKLPRSRPLALRLTGALPLLALGLPALALLPACGAHEDDAFRNSVPTSDTVAMNVPGAAPASGSGAHAAGENTAVARSALLGEKAEYYTTTRDVTALVNGATYAVLTLVRTIVTYPASHVAGEIAVWGPYTDPLSPNTWRLTVTRLDPHVFGYVLEGRAKQADDSAFVAILTGQHTAAVDASGAAIAGFGSGNFTVDWNAQQTLPEHDATVGNAAFTYSRLDASAVESIAVTFVGIKDATTAEIYNADYQYAATPGAGGDFQYAAHRDVFPGPGPTGSAQELLTMHSRWQETGAGRADVQISGGDTPVALAPITTNECWDQNFLSQYKNLSYDPTSDWGLVSSCVFADASYSSLD
jgi:hypothetical protein